MDYKAENIKAKKTLLKMADVVKNVEDGKARYMIAKVMDLYRKLPVRFQHAFIEFFCDEMPHESWTRCLEDETLYISAIRSITMYYTGIEKSSGAETTLSAFRNQIVQFLKSDFYKRARVVVKPKTKTFADRLADL